MTEKAPAIIGYSPNNGSIPLYRKSNGDWERGSYVDGEAGYYSDNGVDIWIEKYLPEFGYAAEVGANNGYHGSNCLRYEQKGWVVLCVEPNPLLEAEGRQRRRLWRSVAASDQTGEQRFIALGMHPFASGSGMVRPDGTMAMGDSTHGQSFTVKTETLDNLLEQAGFPRLDLLTIDAEGWEDNIMSGFTIERWKPTIIVREDLSDNDHKYPGYERINRMQFDCIYKRVAP